MSNYVKLATEAGDQYLNLLAEGQEQFLKSLNAFAAATPALYAVPTPPVVADIPTPREIAEANFAFAAKLLKQQKVFAEKLFAATTPAARS
jgi:hypothetical protein